MGIEQHHRGMSLVGCGVPGFAITVQRRIVRASSSIDPVAQPRADFDAAAERVLTKNQELYRRLA